MPPCGLLCGFQLLYAQELNIPKVRLIMFVRGSWSPNSKEIVSSKYMFHFFENCTSNYAKLYVVWTITQLHLLFYRH